LNQNNKAGAAKYFEKTLVLEPRHELALFQIARLNKNEAPLQNLARTPPPVIKKNSKPVARTPNKTTAKKRVPASARKTINKKTMKASTKTKKKKK
jgi:hypothetical protein